MAFRKKMFRKKRLFKRKRWGRKTSTKFKAAPKYYIESASTSASTTVSQYNLGDGIAQGTANNQRLVEKIWLGGVRLNYNVIAGDATQIVRVAVICPRSVGVAPPPGMTVDTILDRRFYKVLYDKRHGLVGNVSSDTYQLTVRKYLKVNSVIQYSGTSGASLTGYFCGLVPWICIISDSLAIPHATVNHQTTCVFKDCLM